jgi:hypothetical protein
MQDLTLVFSCFSCCSADHVPSDLGVVLQLTSILAEKGARYVFAMSAAASVQQSAEHDRLIDMRHPHVAFYEPEKVLKVHVMCGSLSYVA